MNLPDDSSGLPPEGKVPYIKVTRPATHGDKYGCWSPLKGFSVEAEFDGAEVGERIVLELCELTRDEILAMPEFEGW